MALEEPRRHQAPRDAAGGRPAERALTRDELRAGLLRLAVIVALLLLCGVSLGWLFAATSDVGVRRGVANGLALVGALVLVFALASWMRTGPLRREGLRARMAELEERRESERLALGLVGVGLAFFFVALLLG